MIEMDLEDYIEEVKFQMVDAYDDVLNKDTILAWEDGARAWVEQYLDKREGAKSASAVLRFRSEDEIYVKLKSEEVCETMARKYYQAVINNALDGYWKNFCIV